MDSKNLQELKWNELTEKLKLDMYRVRTVLKWMMQINSEKLFLLYNT